MSEMEKKDIPAEEVHTEPAAEETATQETPAEEIFTVTREQMEKMEQLAKMLAESSDKYLRLAAEYDNYRKRTAKEKEGLYSAAKADTAKPFLDVYDNLLRGAAQYPEGDPNRQGLDMICKQFVEVLAKLGVTEIEALGKPFDPELHNAVMHVDDASLGENIIAEEFQKGFKLGEKVIRFSVVKVAN